MTRTFLLAAALPLALAPGCELLGEDADVVADIVSARGRIEQAERDRAPLIVTDHAPPGMEEAEGPFYLSPLNLPEKYWRDGLRVVFSADVEGCDDVGQCIALPVTIVEIRRSPW